MRRRDFIAGIGVATGAAVHSVWAQQPATRTIGFIGATSAEAIEPRLAAFRAGLKEAGFAEGKDVNVAYRFAGGNLGAAPALVQELLANHVDAIVTAGGPPLAKAAMDATKTVPIVFTTASDPVADGLVTSLARPAGNATGATFYSGQLEAKQYELVREVVPNAKTVAVTALPLKTVDEALQQLQHVASSNGGDVIELTITKADQLDSVLMALVQRHADAVIIDDLISNQNIPTVLAFLDAHRVPAIFGIREFTAGGGLMSYGASIDETYRQVGVYTGRILKGASPHDLPVVQPTKFDLAINLKTAKTLGLTIPTTLLATADEVIE
jgi:putative ABC transport system substrate-binding protein